ncbi:MAG TPA: hypothetical protein VMY34_01470 [Acidimicrobiales bacterium]|nr:hypothetical protein [Acidimicrobiales bacterium]
MTRAERVAQLVDDLHRSALERVRLVSSPEELPTRILLYRADFVVYDAEEVRRGDDAWARVRSMSDVAIDAKADAFAYVATLQRRRYELAPGPQDGAGEGRFRIGGDPISEEWTLWTRFEDATGMVIGRVSVLELGDDGFSVVITEAEDGSTKAPILEPLRLGISSSISF